MMFMVMRFFLNSHSCCPPNISAAFLAWFSHFHVILYARCLSFSVPCHFGQWVSLLSAISSLFCGYLLFRCSSLNLGVSGLFINRWHSLSSSRHGYQRAISLFLSVLNYTYTMKLWHAYVVLVHRAATRWCTCPTGPDFSFRPTVRTGAHAFWSLGTLFVLF